MLLAWDRPIGTGLRGTRSGNNSSSCNSNNNSNNSSLSSSRYADNSSSNSSSRCRDRDMETGNSSRVSMDRPSQENTISHAIDCFLRLGLRNICKTRAQTCFRILLSNKTDSIRSHTIPNHTPRRETGKQHHTENKPNNKQHM